VNLYEAFRIALRGLRANRLRSVLTTLGIVIGVSAVIILTALGDGIKAGFSEQFGSLANQISVTPSQGDRTARDITDNDVEALTDRVQAPDIASVVPIVTGAGLVQQPGGIRYRTSITGTTARYAVATNLDLLVGTFFDESQERAKAKVVILGPGPVTELFGGDAGRAMGADVRIGRSTFRVIGVTKPAQQDDLVIMPIDAARSYVLGGDDTVDRVVVEAASAAAVPAAEEQVNAILGARHNIDEPSERDFQATPQQELLDDANQFLNFLSLFTTAIAGISLVVGGIGVANIMLVSVTERTREIGIRKAIGATRRAILQQFLLESTVLAALGGLIGVVFGIGISLVGGVVLPRAVPDFPPPTVSVAPVILAMSISLAIGLIAGGYPANRAARMRPIDALRYQ
jgi:putative ABC transport system permease protein